MIIEGVLVFRSVVYYVNQVSWSIISSSLSCAEGDIILLLFFLFHQIQYSILFNDS